MTIRKMPHYVDVEDGQGLLCVEDSDTTCSIEITPSGRKHERATFFLDHHEAMTVGTFLVKYAKGELRDANKR